MATVKKKNEKKLSAMMVDMLHDGLTKKANKGLNALSKMLTPVEKVATYAKNVNQDAAAKLHKLHDQKVAQYYERHPKSSDEAEGSDVEENTEIAENDEALENEESAATEESTENEYSEEYLKYLAAVENVKNNLDTSVYGNEESAALEALAEEYSALSEKYIKDYINRDAFEYDVNTDKLYATYRDQYLKNARAAQRDASAQAAALTGGYGSSYASAVGNEAHSAELDKLNEKAAELYDNAYSTYLDEGARLLENAELYSGLASERYADSSAIKENALSMAEAESELGSYYYQNSDEYASAAEAEEDAALIEGGYTSLKESFAQDAKITSSKYKMQSEGSQTGYKGIANAIDLERGALKNIESYESYGDFIDDLYERLSTVTINGVPMTDAEMAAYVDWVISAYGDELTEKFVDALVTS